MVLSIVSGQIIALVVAVSALVTKVLFDRFSFNLPSLQNAFGYAVLALLASIKGVDRPSRGILGSMFLIALADSQATFLGNLAYRFDVSIASVGMLSSFTVPCAMVLSRVFLKVRYLKTHYLGTLVALLGMFSVVYADSGTSDSSRGSGSGNALYGDLLVLLGSFFYAMSNVASEYLLKGESVSITLYMFLLGLFGSCISLLQYAVLESRREFGDFDEHKRQVAGLIMAHALVFALCYLLVTLYLKRFDSVVFNLSLLTTDVWGLLFGHFIFKEQVQLLKLAGFACIVLGVGLYNYQQPIENQRHIEESLEESTMIQQEPESVEMYQCHT